MIISLQANGRRESKRIKISASLMCMDWLNVGKQVAILEALNIDYLHIDVIDGRFAPDFTMGSSIISAIREITELPFDYHLMVENPSPLFGAFPLLPGDIFTIHAECCRNLHRDLVAIRRRDVRVGVAICPATPIEALEYVIEDVDHIVVMTVNPGFMGQALVPQTLRKIQKLRKMIVNLGVNVTIAVDGNVNYDNIPKMIAAGADVLVGGSSGIFRKDMTLQDSVSRFNSAIKMGLSENE